MATFWFEENRLLLIDKRIKMPSGSYFRKVTEMDVKWTRNQPCTIRKSTLCVVPTNFRRISYLNLEEFSFDGQALVGELQEYSVNIGNTCRLKTLQDLYSLECSQRKYDYADLFTYTEMLYMVHVQFNLSYDAACYANSLMTESRHGLPDSFMRGRIFDARISLINDAIFDSQTHRVMNDLQDSGIIVHYFKNLFSNPKLSLVISDIELLRYIDFFFEHSLKAKFDARGLLCQLARRHRWFKFQSPIQMTLMRSNTEDLACYLNRLMEIKCPFMVSWIKRDISAHDDILWPLLGVNGAPQTYFHSYEFRARLIYDLNKVIYENISRELREKITSNIRVLWRAIPTPFLPFEDLKLCFRDIMVDTQCINYGCIFSFENPTCFHARSWKTFKRVFPEDCIAETYQPRSLKHLSRCAVRQTMYNAPTAFPFQYLPTYLRKYLGLEC